MKPPFMKPSSQIASHPIPLLPPQSPPPLFFPTERKMNFVVIVIPWAGLYLSTKLTENDSEYSTTPPPLSPYKIPL